MEHKAANDYSHTSGYDSDSEVTFHNEFSDSEYESDLESVTDGDTVHIHSQTDETTTINGLYHPSSVPSRVPKTGHFNDTCVENLSSVSSCKTHIPQSHRKPAVHKNLHGHRPYPSVNNTMRNDATPEAASKCSENFSCYDKSYADSRDLSDRNPSSKCHFGDNRRYFFSDSTKTRFHDDFSNTDSNNSAFHDRSYSVEDIRPVQENEAFTEWNCNWITDDFLYCPISISRAAMTDGDYAASGEYDNPVQSSRCKSSGKHGTKIPHTFHIRKKKNKNHRHGHGIDDEISKLMMYNPMLFLAKKAKESGFDFATVLEIAGPVGCELKFPCMQCYEVYGDRHSGRKSCRDPADLTGRCAKCGGKVSTLQSLSVMISNTKKLLVEKNFEFYDVYPDGNCMFRTIVDQLRVRGNFRFTIYSLREAVVDYLRRNPYAEDETHLEMFLSGETWEEYLIRMSEDGQWGDHLVLKAISNILQMRLVIYGGISVETETNIAPDGRNDGNLPVINMLHMGETHYVSLRSKNWRKELQEENHKHLELWKQGDSRINASFKFMTYPVMHLDFILRNTFSLDYINSFLAEDVGKLPDQSMESDEIRISMVGPVMCKLAPTFSNPTESITLDESLIFPVEDKEDVVHYLIKFKTPIDTSVHTRGAAATQSFDLFVEKKDTSQLLVHLIPVVPASWEPHILPLGPGSVCLKTFELPNSLHEEKHKTEACIVKHQVLVAFQCTWPDSANEWLVRERPSNFPTSSIVDSIKTKGCHIIPVLSLQTQKDVIDCTVTQEMIDHQELWCYSFAEAETQICGAMVDDQRHCYLILKTSLDIICKESPIPSSLLKSVYFYACENIESQNWRQQPGVCLLIMLDKLIQGFKGKFIPHYFIPRENLIRNIQEDSIAVWIDELEYMRFDPITKLFFTFDAIGLTFTEVDGMFDEVIDDFLKYGRHKRFSRSFQESLVPAAGHLVESLVYLGDFQYAMVIIENIYEQWKEVSNRPVSLVNVILYSCRMALGYQWCLAFMIDTKLNTRTSEEICRSMDSVHITELFGPEIVEEMPNTVVPITYSIANGDLIFPTVCSKVIEQTGNMYLLAKSLRYYLETYSSVAGDNLIIENHHCHCGSSKCLKTVYIYSMLLKLYVKLLDAYVDTNQVESFRELMPLFTKIVTADGGASSYSYLAYAWEMLGDKKKASQYGQVQNTENNMEQYFKSLMNMLGVE